MTESLIEYKKRIKKVTGPRNHKIKGSYGVQDAYRWYMKKCNAQKKKYLTSTEYYKIIRGVNKLLGDYVVEGEPVRLPCRMGEIIAFKTDPSPRLKEDGTLKVYYPIDWNKTLELWYEDEEAERDNVVVRIHKKENFRAMLSKRHAQFQNQKYYRFNLIRVLKERIIQKQREGTMSGFLLFKPNYG